MVQLETANLNTQYKCSNIIVSSSSDIYRLMQPTLYSDDSTSRGKQPTLVVQLAVVTCCVRVSYSNGESGIRQAGVCNNWRCVLKVISPLIRYSLPRWLWVYYV